MSESKRIKSALVSVYHKDGLDSILQKLHQEGVSFISTGGTQKFIESLEIPCKAVEDLTGYPSILGGRVKTLTRKSSEVFLEEEVKRVTFCKWHNMKFRK